MTIRYLSVTVLTTLLLALSGCASKPSTLYQWQGYQANVDRHFRADSASLDAQVQSMQSDLQKIQAQGAAVPPGYHAHLGLLYGQQGNMEGFVAQMQMEKKLFPESQTYVDFLLRNLKK